MSVRSFSLAAALAVAFAAPSIAVAQSVEPIVVTIDHAKVMRISAPAETIIVGNPAIADATIYDRQTIVITGKTAGTTNLVVLDNKGKPIADEILKVAIPSDKVVSIQRGPGTAQFTYACTPICAPILTPGDDKEYFEVSNNQINNRNNMSNQAAGATGQ
jgi:Pilus formation protein N terminal region